MQKGELLMVALHGMQLLTPVQPGPLASFRMLGENSLKRLKSHRRLVVCTILDGFTKVEKKSSTNSITSPKDTVKHRCACAGVL